MDEYFRDWESNAFGFGYGSGEEFIIPTIKKFMALVPELDAESRTYDSGVLEKELGGETAWFLINVFGKQDIIEYGTSPRFAWLTEQGYALKKYLSERSVDQLFEAIQHDESYAECWPDSCNCTPDECHNPFWENHKGRTDWRK